MGLGAFEGSIHSALWQSHHPWKKTVEWKEIEAGSLRPKEEKNEKGKKNLGLSSPNTECSLDRFLPDPQPAAFLLVEIWRSEHPYERQNDRFDV